MAQRVRIPHRGQGPSSVRQLPILTALHARFPTLFLLIIHEKRAKVNPYFILFLSISATQTEEPAGEWEFLVNLMKKLSKLVEIYLLFVRFPFIMNTICYKGGVGVGRTDRVCVR